MRELNELRTESSKTYLLADGLKRTVVFNVPVHFRDGAGAWREIDTELLPAAADGALFDVGTLSPGVFEAAATQVDISIASESASRAPIALSYAGFQITLNLIGGREENKIVAGDTATFLDVASATDVTYEVVANGLKETIILASPAAPDSFCYWVSHPGLELREDETGQWGFYRPGVGQALLHLADVLTYDSSRNEAGDPAYADRARMSVHAADGGSYVTYAVPRAWLDDPARVYPVMIDPSITLGQSVCNDTYISSANPGTSFGSSSDLKAGKSTTSDDNWSLIKFDVAQLQDLNAYVTSAHLRMNQYYAAYSPPRLTYVDIMSESWSESTTWNTLCADGQVGRFAFDTQTQFTDGWLDQPCAWVTQAWMNGELANQGFTVYQSAGQGTTYYRKFRSSEYGSSTSRPRLVVDYTNPTAAISNTEGAYQAGDLVHATVTIDDLGAESGEYIQELRLGVNRASGQSSDYRGVMSWCRGGVPDGSGNWSSSPYKDNGGYFSAYESPTDSTGNRYITPQLNRCDFDQGSATFDFYFRINRDFPVSTDNHFAVLMKIRTPNIHSDPLDEGFRVWSSDWEAVEPSFDIEAPVEASVSGDQWFLESTGPSGTQSDSNDGRGRVTLSWPAAANADGYEVYLWDGARYEKVAQTVVDDLRGDDGTAWNMAYWLPFAPPDAEVAGAGTEWPAGSGGLTPFYRATTPSASSLVAAPAPTHLNNSAGVVASDGSDVYVRGRAGQEPAGPALWQRYSGSTGAWLGEIAITPSAAPLSAFYYDGYLYSGTTMIAGGAVTVKGVRIDPSKPDLTRTLTFDTPPLDRTTGLSVSTTTATTNILLAATPDGGCLYSVAYTRTQSGGTPNLDGYKIRYYHVSGQSLVWDGTSTVNMPSQKVSGVMLDSNAMFLIGWTGGENALLTRIGRDRIALESNARIDNQWLLDQGSVSATAGACSGAYVAGQAGGVFWLGHLTASQLYKFAGAGGGLDLRDNPNALYRKNGTRSRDWTHYSFRVVPYTGLSLTSNPDAHGGTMVTLKNRTMHLNEAPLHPSVVLPAFAGHAAAVRLDSEALWLARTDLAVNSWGPPASLERVHLTTRTPSVPTLRFAPGWRFGFERSLDLSTPAQEVRYTDLDGDRWRYVGSGPTYAGPYGTCTWLEHDVVAGRWYLHRKDRSVLGFDAQGRLASETDAQGNAVLYEWSGTTGLTIRAANGQSLVIAFEAGSGRITSAQYQSWGQMSLPAVRRVEYSCLDADTWAVDYQPGQPERSQVRYTTSGSALTQLTAMRPTAQGAWEIAGREFFTYQGGSLFSVSLPEWSPPYSIADARITISYVQAANEPSGREQTTGSAQFTRYGAVGGSSGHPLSTTYTWNRYGALESVCGPYESGETLEPTRFVYAPSNRLAATTSPLGLTSRAAIDVRGNVIAAADPLGHGSVSVYPDYDALDAQGQPNPLRDLPQATVDASGATSYFTYDAAGNLLSTQSEIAASAARSYDPSLPPEAPLTPSASALARSDAEYGPVSLLDDGSSQLGAEAAAYYGGVVLNGALLSTTTQTGGDASTAHNLDFDISGQVRWVQQANVKLDAAGPGQNLSTHHTYDTFGSLLTTTDALGHLTETNEYDSLGRLIASSGPTFKTGPESGAASYQVTGHSLYDALGNLVESYATSNDPALAGKRLNDVVRSLSPSGWLLDESFRDGFAASAQPAYPELSHTTYTNDGLGHQVAVDDSKVGGQPGRTDYDARGNVIAAWPEGRATYDVHGAERADYDADGRVIAEWQPGGIGSTLASVAYTYDAASRVVREERRSGSWAEYAYDASGRTVVTRTPTADYSATQLFETAVQTSQYDLLGDLLCSVNAAGVKTSYVYDLAGRQTRETLLTPEPGDGSAPPDDGVTGLDNAQTDTTYNTLGWTLTQVGIEDVSTATSYNADGTPSSHAEGDILTRYTYNEAGQVLTRKLGPTSNPSQVSRQSDYSYNGFGEATKQAGGPSGDTASRIVVDSAYDMFGRLVETTRRQGPDGASRIIWHRSFVYFAPSEPTVIKQTTTYGRSGAGSPAGTPDELIAHTLSLDVATRAVAFGATRAGLPEASGAIATRDAADRVTETRLTLCGAPQLSSTYAYDANDHLASQGGAGFVATPALGTYTYDDLTGRLSGRWMEFASSGAGLQGNIDASYAYDESGRLKTGNDTHYTFNGGGSLTKVVSGTTTTELHYTARQRLTLTRQNGIDSGFYSWDATNGRRTREGPTASQTVNYSFAADGTLTQITDGAASSSFTYDADGQRLSKQVTNGATTAYTYDGLQLLALAASKANGESWSFSYLYDGAGRPFAGYYEAAAGGVVNESAWFALVCDLRGDVLELLDADGARFASYRYSVWGQPQGLDDGVGSCATTRLGATLAERIAVRQPLRYAGYVYDEATALYYCGARYYDPASRQFISRDPATADGARSAYQYVGGNPVLARDPSGLYATASGERTNTEFYVPQTNRRYQAGNGDGATYEDAEVVTSPTGAALRLAGGGGRYGLGLGVAAPVDWGWAASVARGVGDFLWTGAETFSYVTGNPWAPSPFGDNANADMAFSAGLMFFDPAMGLRGLGRAGLGLGEAAARGGRLSGELGRAAEDAIASRFVEPGTRRFFRTARGGRFVDIVTPAGVGIESKSGYTSLSVRVREQIARDVLLRKERQLPATFWDFSRSTVTGRVGPSAPLARALDKAGIRFWVQP